MVQKKKIHKSFLNCLINQSITSGKKSIASRAVIGALGNLAKKTNSHPYKIVRFIYKQVRSFVEVRAVRVRRTSYLVPFPLNRQRQSYIAARWVLSSMRLDNSKTSFVDKLEKEFSQIINSTGGTLSKRKKINQLASKNRSNMHYRWY